MPFARIFSILITRFIFPHIHFVHRKYQAVSPILNHPGSFHSLCDENKKWLGDALTERECEKLEDHRGSPKFVILAHILAMAHKAGEKTLVYSKSLKTLDKVESLLQSPDWLTEVGYPKNAAREIAVVGCWKKNKEYLCMDGSTNSGIRGSRVDKFNDNETAVVFLMSSEACGLGINLVSS